jgi:hypothetical protein
MSDTPRTDDVFYKIDRNEWVVDADFARELERENACLRMALEPFAREWATWRGKSNKAVMICEAGFSPTDAEFTQDDLERAALFLANVRGLPRRDSDVGSSA